jgi:tRNA (guanine37-N1)-methyltransferase
MIIHILTLFPEVFEPVFSTSIIKRAQEKGLATIKIYNLRDWASDKHGTVDDRPYGGGAGMVLKVEPLYQAISDIKNNNPGQLLVFLLSPRGKTFNQQMAQNLATEKQILLICGHYEGFDERIRNFVNGEIAIGDYVLTGGEIPVMAITDAVIRLIPGVLKKTTATEIESFSQMGLEYPQYTRPEVFQDLAVPAILLSGDHKKIAAWQEKEAKKITQKYRPDLLKQKP